MSEIEDRRPFNSGRPMKTSDIEYRTLYYEMLKARIRPWRVSKVVGIDYKTMMDGLRGKREWKLWEAFAIKETIGSTMPVEELFKRNRPEQKEDKC